MNEMKKYLLILCFLYGSILCIEWECNCNWIANGTAECSNCKNVDYECVAEKKPNIITLKANGYTTVPDELLQNCNSLKDIYLSSNYIQKLPEKLMSYCPQLVYINLDYTHISNPKELFKIDQHVQVQVRHVAMDCDCNDAGEVLPHTNAQKATVMCGVTRYEKQITIPYAKFCNELLLNEANLMEVKWAVAVSLMHALYALFH